MPQLGETVTEGTITRWMKAVGDQVARDEPLFEVSTDKVDSEVPAPASGVLSEILVAEGETVEVGARLAVIGDSAPAPAGPSAPSDQAVPASPSAPAPAPSEPQVAPPPAPPEGFRAQASVAAPVPEASSGPPPQPPALVAEVGDPRLLSPVVRRLLADNGIDPGEVMGTGVGGRITREDVLAMIDTRHAGAPVAPAQDAGAPQPPPAATQPVAPAPAPPRAPSGPPAVSSAPVASYLPAGDKVVPFSNMRRRTAEHMVRSKATSPHAFIANEVDFENVERVRRAWGERFKSEEGFPLTYLPFIARAAVEALRDFPNLNASVADGSLVLHQQVNLGIAVDLHHEGLIVPVIHRAEEVTLRGVARRIRDLADRARTRQLTADDISGGTFSITNDGPFGTFFTVPIINQPQVAILATDGIKRRPVVVELPDGTESIAIHSTGVLGMSWDHRAVDGAYVSSYLRRVAELLGGRDWAAEL
jgi:2-oxoglutarate dehydrogenase E2 component (dihydrolipoamide succinyltransferase)